MSFTTLALCSSSVTCICGPASSASLSSTTSSWMESLITFKVRHSWSCISSCLLSTSLLLRQKAVNKKTVLICTFSVLNQHLKCSCLNTSSHVYILNCRCLMHKINYNEKLHTGTMNHLFA
ncbi:hypothetical protein PGIGA_G00237770 [Pangasianodon gigas]|uniref:Uncharacterized protein n=1 Tax=Pangasianodon gigas TaxID=30993 RepID=A0ACC5WMI4_PANGG|nr:hypothetical protein [Pangasianodon gigas]